MAVHKGSFMGRDLNFEDVHVLVFQSKVMVGLGADFHFLGTLSGQAGQQQSSQQSGSEFHGRDSSTARAALSNSAFRVTGKLRRD
jgi:hypothetical protein